MQRLYGGVRGGMRGVQRWWHVAALGALVAGRLCCGVIGMSSELHALPHLRIQFSRFKMMEHAGVLPVLSFPALLMYQVGESWCERVPLQVKEEAVEQYKIDHPEAEDGEPPAEGAFDQEMYDMMVAASMEGSITEILNEYEPEVRKEQAAVTAYMQPKIDELDARIATTQRELQKVAGRLAAEAEEEQRLQDEQKFNRPLTGLSGTRPQTSGNDVARPSTEHSTRTNAPREELTAQRSRLAIEGTHALAPAMDHPLTASLPGVDLPPVRGMASRNALAMSGPLAEPSGTSSYEPGSINLRPMQKHVEASNFEKAQTLHSILRELYWRKFTKQRTKHRLGCPNKLPSPELEAAAANLAAASAAGGPEAVASEMGSVRGGSVRG